MPHGLKGQDRVLPDPRTSSSLRDVSIEKVIRSKDLVWVNERGTYGEDG